ncbi:predicted protein [Botrytis cinerea T4]|uniref:Uncharacterized protein n=1 Tax=Botryotinia fuckeliana (strain T4) TaxID=999810 RepID=G2YPW3_BOTF4|nr:predicted protein [Botrytis cinerea T4]
MNKSTCSRFSNRESEMKSTNSTIFSGSHDEQTGRRATYTIKASRNHLSNHLLNSTNATTSLLTFFSGLACERLSESTYHVHPSFPTSTFNRIPALRSGHLALLQPRLTFMPFSM